jgi:hypothetical protein
MISLNAFGFGAPGVGLTVAAGLEEGSIVGKGVTMDREEVLEESPPEPQPIPKVERSKATKRRFRDDAFIPLFKARSMPGEAHSF